MREANPADRASADLDDPRPGLPALGHESRRVSCPRAGSPGRGSSRSALALSAGFASLMFAIHPLRVESVAWATERRDVLSGLFYLLTILMYLRACERGERRRGWYWLSVAVFICALLSK